MFIKPTHYTAGQESGKMDSIMLMWAGILVVWFIGIPIWVWNRRRHLSPALRAQTDFYAATNPSSGEDSITNFDSAAGQLYQMRVEQGFERLKPES
jgi:hypothetical protein